MPRIMNLSSWCTVDEAQLHVMPDYDLYSPSYIVAAVRAAELDRKLENLFGADCGPRNGEEPRLGGYRA